LLIRVKASTTIEEKTAERVVGIFTKEFPNNTFVVDSTTEIGPTIGKKLQEDALIAIVISFAGIIMYIAARFELRFGVAAALATFHDVLAVVGAFYILDKEITLLIVTALLTLAGYSLTDTVVVFDRIRENLRMRRRETEEETINNAVNQVLSRTIVTSVTVVLVLIPLTLAGGEVLHDFSLALLWGVIIGTYSSVFVASPLVLLWPGSGGRLLKRS
jgi:preprotein translocase subunit SecF